MLTFCTMDCLASRSDLVAAILYARHYDAGAGREVPNGRPRPGEPHHLYECKGTLAVPNADVVGRCARNARCAI